MHSYFHAHEAVLNELERSWVVQLYREWQETLRYYQLPPLATPLITLHEGKQRYGYYDALQRRLSLSVHLLRDYSWDVVLEIFKHEIAHALVASTETAEEEAHGPAFQRACTRLGIAPWARHAHIEVDPSTAVQQHRQMSEDEERWLRRVEKLLSLGGSSNSHEASLAMEKARELSARHQLESVLKGQPARYTYALIQHGKKVMPAHQSGISSILCTHFYVDCVSRNQFDAKSATQLKVLEILGTRENVQMAEYVYWFLWNQLPLLWNAHRKAKESEAKSASASTRTSQRSFYLGVLNGFHEKLSKQSATLRDNVRSWGLELSGAKSLEIERQAAAELRQFVRERYPRLNRGAGSRQGLIYDDYHRGHAKGQELNLHRGLTETHRGAIQLLQSGKG